MIRDCEVYCSVFRKWNHFLKLVRWCHTKNVNENWANDSSDKKIYLRKSAYKASFSNTGIAHQDDFEKKFVVLHHICTVVYPKTVLQKRVYLYICKHNTRTFYTFRLPWRLPSNYNILWERISQYPPFWYHEWKCITIFEYVQLVCI